MGQGLIKVFQHSGASGAVLHGLVAGAYGVRHLALAHIGSNDCGFLAEIFLHPAKDLGKIGGSTSKSGCAEQKYPLAGQAVEKLSDLLITGAFVGPEADIQGIGSQGGLSVVGSAKIKAFLLGQGLPDGLGQQSGIACAAAVNNGVTLVPYFLS